jgi:hypothetical protein
LEFSINCVVTVPDYRYGHTELLKAIKGMMDANQTKADATLTEMMARLDANKKVTKRNERFADHDGSQDRG